MQPTALLAVVKLELEDRFFCLGVIQFLANDLFHVFRIMLQPFERAFLRPDLGFDFRKLALRHLL